MSKRRQGSTFTVPSGNANIAMKKWPCLIGKPSIHGYVILPEGSFSFQGASNMQWILGRKTGLVMQPMWLLYYDPCSIHVTVMGLQSNSIQQRLPSNLDAIVKQSHQNAGDETSLELRDFSGLLRTSYAFKIRSNFYVLAAALRVESMMPHRVTRCVRFVTSKLLDPIDPWAASDPDGLKTS